MKSWMKKSQTMRRNCPRQYVYDIECMIIENEAKPGIFVHEVNLIMVAPLNGCKESVQEFCSLKDFFSWALQKERGKSTFWAHNAKGYDKRFLFDFIVQELNMEVKKMAWRGDKLLSFTLRGRKFCDSLCHLGRALHELPSMLGLNVDVAKGFFPHKFNVPKNQSYIGPLPGKEFFEAERFTPERKAAFDQWYEEAKACKDWSLQTKLREYCRSDVIVLGEALSHYDALMRGLNSHLSPLTNVTLPAYAIRVYLNLHCRIYIAPQKLLQCSL